MFKPLKTIASTALASSLMIFSGLSSATDNHAWCGHDHWNKQVEVRVVTPFPEGHILAEAAHKFKKKLEKRSRHFKVSVETGFMNEQTVNPASQPCDPDERVADVIFTGGQPIQDYAPEYFFFNGPYVIRDFEHLQSVWSSDIGSDMADQILLEGNFYTFDPVYRGYRQFTSNTPIEGPADLDGIRLRLPPVPTWIKVWEELNAVPVPVPLNELYESLANGTAEASEGDLTQIHSFKLYEVQNHLSLTNHLASFGMPIVNACFYEDELSRGHQAKFKRAMRKTVNWATAKLQESEAELLSELESLGMTTVTPDAAAIREQAEPAINELFATEWTVTTWEEVLAK